MRIAYYTYDSLQSVAHSMHNRAVVRTRRRVLNIFFLGTSYHISYHIYL